MGDQGGPPLTGLGILVDEKRVNDLLTQKTGVKAMLRSGCNLALFVVFLLLFTVLALSEPLGDHRAFEGYLRRRFDDAAAMPLREVESVSSFWQFLETSFMAGLYGNDTRRFYFPTYVPAKLLEIESGNRLLGVARIRMLKINPNEGCSVADRLESYFPTCYGPYNPLIADTDSFGPPDEATGDAVFQSYGGSTESTVSGELADYFGGGFMEAFTTNHNLTSRTIARMRQYDWIGPGARAIFLDWTVYNFNLGCYGVCRMMFEITPSGAWISSFSVDVLMQRHLNPIANKTAGDWLSLLGEVILVLFVLRYLMEEASEFVGFKGWRPYIKWDYFSDAWNLLDWLNLGMMIATLGMRISTWGLAGNLHVYIGDPAKTSVGTFTDLSGVAANVRIIHGMLAFNMVLTWFKAVKYISILPYITTFMQTVSMSQRALSTFVVVLGCLVFGCMLAYTVAFGQQMGLFRTVWMSFVFLCRSFLGNADFGQVYDHSPMVGAFLILFYVVGMMFVVLNLFYAIIISALADVRKEEDMKSGKKLEQTAGKARDLWEAFSNQFRLLQRFRSSCPGLYARIQIRKKNQLKKEEERDAECMRREFAKRPNAALALGPGDPSKGRKPKPASNSINAEEAFSDSDDASEVDLGPLRNKAQLTRGGMFGDTFGELDGSTPMLTDANAADNGEPPPETIHLIIQATRHVVDGVVDRTFGARGVLLGEMKESEAVLLKVGNVLEVLGHRARDLEVQQKQLLGSR